MTQIGLTLLAAAIGAAVSIALGLNALRVGSWLGLLDWPDRDGGRKRHGHVTPLVGGVALLAAIVPAALLTLIAGHYGANANVAIAALAVVSILMAVIGVADDRFALRPSTRLAIAVIMLSLTMTIAPDFLVEFMRFTGTSNVILLASAAPVFSLICQIGLLNAVNMADGKNGLVISLGLSWSLLLMLHAPAQLMPLLAALAASLSVLFVFNMRGKLFLGDGGSYGLSTVIGLSAIYCHAHSFVTMRSDVLALLFLVPVADTVRLMVARMAHGRSPFAPGRDHLHHYLASYIGWPKGLFVYLALVVPPNIAGVLLPQLIPLWIALSLIGYVFVVYVARISEKADFLPGRAPL